MQASAEVRAGEGHSPAPTSLIRYDGAHGSTRASFPGSFRKPLPLRIDQSTRLVGMVDARNFGNVLRRALAARSGFTRLIECYDQPAEDREVRMQPRPPDAADPERQQRPLVLQASELALDRPTLAVQV